MLDKLGSGQENDKFVVRPHHFISGTYSREQVVSPKTTLLPQLLFCLSVISNHLAAFRAVKVISIFFNMTFCGRFCLFHF